VPIAKPVLAVHPPGGRLVSMGVGGSHVPAGDRGGRARREEGPRAGMTRCHRSSSYEQSPSVSCVELGDAGGEVSG
jgi:hypothetical protein